MARWCTQSRLQVGCVGSNDHSLYLYLYYLCISISIYFLYISISPLLLPSPHAHTHALTCPLWFWSLVALDSGITSTTTCTCHTKEFDLTEGNTIRTTYPPDARFSNKEELSNLCFPEGAHLHHHDWTTLCLWDEVGKTQLMCAYVCA
jgi:hypothetical protein